MEYLPIFVQLRNQSCLIVGSGDGAQRKAELLQQAGARIKILSRTFTSTFQAYAKDHNIQLVYGEFDESHLHDVALVVVATKNMTLSRHVSNAATSKRILVNVIDNPELSTFILPAIIDRSPITVAIGTGGQSPVLARLLRGKIESMIPFEYGALAQLTGRYRDRVKKLFSTGTSRKNFWERVYEGSIAEKVLAGKLDDAESELKQLLDSRHQLTPERGEVYLVGAGPGDPELLTFKALRLMQRADVVIYDRLVSPEVLSLVRRDAQQLYVGKEANHHCVPQQKINQTLVEFASQGKRVVRLKGGDPFIFGRGGEEAEALVAAGIDFQVVPGITSAAGAASYCGIPLTHRDYAQSVTFTTGHLKEGTIDIDWNSVTHGQHTLVIYMGLRNLPIISQQLIEHGLSAHTPVAVVSHATRSNQEHLIGNLMTIAEQVRQAQVCSPAVIIIGEVVLLHEKLNPVAQPEARCEATIGLEEQVA